MLSQMPTTKIDSMVSVVAARVSTAAIAHQDSTGICAPSSLVDHVPQAGDFGLDAGEALHQGDVAERVGGAFGEVAVVALDRALQRLGLARPPARSARRTRRTARSAAAPSRQLMNSDSGSSTISETKAAKCSRKNASHSHHSESVPVSITFISRPECAPPW